MLLRKHQYIALFSSSLSLLALVNCSDSDGTLNNNAGSAGSTAGEAEPGGGASSKAGASNGHSGAASHAGATSGTAGESSKAGKDAGGASGAPDTGDAGAGGTEDAAGAAPVAGGGGAPGAGAGGAPHAGAGGAPAGGAPGAGAGGAPAAGAGGGAPVAGAGGAPGPHQGPILKYNFDEGTGTVAADVSGLGFNGTVALSTAWTAQGRNGAGLALAGGVEPTTYVTVPPGVFKDVKNTTIATWVKLNLDIGWNRIFDFGGKGTGTDTRFMYLTTNTPGTGVYFSTFGGAPAREAVVSTGTLLPLTVWKHVAVTIADGGKRAIYLDGFPAAGATTVDVPPSELEPMSSSSWIGKSRFDADAGLNGVLDEFQIYDRVLAPAEIAALAYPKADYTRIPFDEGSGTTSADTSTRAVNATLNGGASWASGRLGAAVQLSGDSQYVTLSSSPLAGCTTSATISLWVKEVAAATWARILDFGGTSDNFMFLTPSNGDGKLQLSIHITGTETLLTSATTVPADSAWHHVAVVITPAVATVFIDGSAVGNAVTPVTPAVLGTTNEHWLGKSRFPDPYFNGSFDEVRVSCRAFTSDEIKSLAFR